MGYVVAGYVVVLGLLALYALSLVWRRRRLVRAAVRLESLAPGEARPDTASSPDPR